MATTPVGSNVPSNVGQQTSSATGLAEWAGEPVTRILGTAESLAARPYESYTGPLTAGGSNLQSQAFTGIGGLTIPTDQMKAYVPQTFTAESAQSYMNPYLMAALQPQIDESRRQADIERINQAGRLSRAGAFGGGRQAIMESELGRNLMSQLGKITGEGYKSAYDTAMKQFNTEQDRAIAATKAAQDYGLAALQKQADMGATERAIEAEGVAADLKQFQEERDDPYKKVEWEREFYKNLPISATNIGYSEPDFLSNLFGTGGGLMQLLTQLGVFPTTPTTPPTTTPPTTTPPTTTPPATTPPATTPPG